MRKILTASALLLASASAFAQSYNDDPAVMSNFSYDYIEARIGASPVTFGLAYSASVHPNAHIIARADSEFEGDYDTGAGLGFHSPINNWADLTGEMLVRLTDDDGPNGTDTGIELNLGVRQWLGPQLEVGGQIKYVSIDDKDNDNWAGSAYARFHTTELFSLGAEARVNDFYGDQLMFTSRFKF